jgi:amino acid transporter
VRRPGAGTSTDRLRRDLGTLESYAALVGILIGAGIFKVTGDAYALTGPSVVLAHLVLAVAVLCTALAYVVFLSTPLGREPGGEYTHVSHTFGDRRVAFVGAWLKLIAYLGAGAYLAGALADYLLALAELLGMQPAPWLARPLAFVGLVLFWAVNAFGARWFGRLQVAMCAVLALSIAVLVVPGLAAVDVRNYQPFFTGGAEGFVSSLVPLFFAYAGFEALAHSAGEVKDSTNRLPRVFVRGILLTVTIFVLMSIVSFGCLSGDELAGHRAPMVAVAEEFLPAGGAALVAVGGVMAVATSLNATLFAPARMAYVLSKDGLLPRALGTVNARTGTPVAGLTMSLVVMGALLASGQVQLALNIAVIALILMYGLHSLALLALPRRNPGLYAQVTARVPRGLQVFAGTLSVVLMFGLVIVQMVADVRLVGTTTLSERVSGRSLTCLELVLVWAAIGVLLYRLRPAQSAGTA